MKIVYLDQNKWIELANVAHGRRESPELRRVLDSLRQARTSAEACFPLSFAHYIETRKRRDRASRVRLAKFMLDLSQRRTLVHHADIIQHELDNALRKRFPDRLKARHAKQMNLLGWGVSHAAGYAPFAMPLAEVLLKTLGVSADDANEFVQRQIDFIALTSLTPSGREVPDADPSPTERRFHWGLAELQVKMLKPALRENILYSRAMQDIRPLLLEAATTHGISTAELDALGDPALRDLLEDMPSVKLDIHLHRQWAKNQNLPAKLNEAYDIAYVGSAAMYCDVVVTENQLADLLRHDEFKCCAQVLTDLRELPRVLGT